MKIEWNKRYNTIAAYTLIVLFIASCFIAILYRFDAFRAVVNTIVSLLVPFIYGFVIAFILNPVLVWLETFLFPRIFKDKLSRPARRGIGVLLTLLFGIFIVVLFFCIIIPQIAISISSITAQIPSYIEQVEKLLGQLVTQYESNQVITAVLNRLAESAEQILQSIYNFISKALPMIVSTTISISSAILKFIVGIIISVYMLLAKERFFAQCKKLLYAFFKKGQADYTLNLTHECSKIFSGFISGKILDSFIIGVLCFLGMTVLKMPYPVLISVIVGLTNVIPYFGPFIGAIPSIIFILLIDPIKALWFAIFILALQQLDGNVIGPKILGQSTGLSAFWVIFSITLFGGLFGFVGMFIGVPTFAVIYMIVRNIAEHLLEKKEMPIATEEYASEENPLLEAVTHSPEDTDTNADA